MIDLLKNNYDTRLEQDSFNEPCTMYLGTEFPIPSFIAEKSLRTMGWETLYIPCFASIPYKLHDLESHASASDQWARSFDILDCFLFLYYSWHDSRALPRNTRVV